MYGVQAESTARQHHPSKRCDDIVEHTNIDTVIKETDRSYRPSLYREIMFLAPRCPSTLAAGIPVSPISRISHNRSFVFFNLISIVKSTKAQLMSRGSETQRMTSEQHKSPIKTLSEFSIASALD